MPVELADQDDWPASPRGLALAGYVILIALGALVALWPNPTL